MSPKTKRGATTSIGSSSWRMTVFWPPRSPSAQTWIRGKPRPSGSAPPASTPPPRQCQPQNGPFPSCDLRDDLEPCSESSEGGSRRFPAAHREDYAALSDVQTLIMKRKAISEIPPAAISSPLLYIFTSSTAEGTKNADRTIIIK